MFNCIRWSRCSSGGQALTWNLYISPLRTLLSTVPPKMYMASWITAAAWNSLPLGIWEKQLTIFIYKEQTYHKLKGKPFFPNYRGTQLTHKWMLKTSTIESWMLMMLLWIYRYSQSHNCSDLLQLIKLHAFLNGYKQTLPFKS